MDVRRYVTSQVVGDANKGYSGLHLGAGANGPLANFYGASDPAGIVDDALGRVTVSNASPGWLFLRTDTGALYKKNSAGAWASIAA